MTFTVLQNRLAGNVHCMRQAAGLSQEELATRCGLHRTYLGAVERNVTLRIVAKIAFALEVDPADLLREMAHHE